MAQHLGGFPQVRRISLPYLMSAWAFAQGAAGGTGAKFSRYERVRRRIARQVVRPDGASYDGPSPSRAKEDDVADRDRLRPPPGAPTFMHRARNFGEGLHRACEDDGWASIALEDVDRATNQLVVTVASSRRVRRTAPMTTMLLGKHFLASHARVSKVQSPSGSCGRVLFSSETKSQAD